MSTSGDGYLPDLNKCAAGETLVVSWDDIFSKLLRHEDDEFSNPFSPFSTFLKSETVRDIFSQPVARFQTSSPQSKPRFDVRTAAINVSPSSRNVAVVQELKIDALWLSAKTNMDEVESLRITVLESQRRPQTHLLQGFSETESASLRDALGHDYDVQGLLPSSMEMSVSTLTPQERRRVNILCTYLKEKTGLLGTSQQLMQRSLVRLGLSPLGFTSRNDKHHSIETQPPNLDDGLFPHLHQASTRLDEVVNYINMVQHIWTDDTGGVDWTGDEVLQEFVSRDWMITRARQLLILLDIILLHIRSTTSILNMDTVKAWFDCMRNCRFFADLATQSNETVSFLNSLQSSVAIVTIAILNPASSIRLVTRAFDREELPVQLSNDSPYFLDHTTVLEIHAVLREAAFGSLIHVLPPMLAWGLIMFALRDVGQGLRTERESRVQRAVEQSPIIEHQTGRRSSTGSIGSIQQSPYEEILDHLTQEFDEPPVEFMTETSVSNGQVFSIISSLATADVSYDSLVQAFKLAALQDLITMAMPVVGYSAEILDSQIAVLDHTSTGAEHFAATPKSRVGAATEFLSDDFLIADLFETSASRFPFEAVPFLRLCRALLTADVSLDNGVHYVTQRLRHMTSFTSEVPTTNLAFHTVHEEENANLVCLEEDISMLGQSGQKLISSYAGEVIPSNWIPAGVIGEVISESLPPVIKWAHSFSGLALLGAWLDLHRSGDLERAVTPTQPVNFLVSEVIELVCSLLSQTLSANPIPNHENPRSVLEDISSGIAQDDDIITVVFDIFEAELQALRYQLDRDSACEVLIACVKFIIVIIRIFPERVWRSLFRSSLVGMRGNEGTLLLVISAAASSVGAGVFFEACSLLYDFLIDDCLSHVKGDLKPEFSDRLRHNVSSRGSIATELMSAQIGSLTRAMMETLESTSNSVWPWTTLQHRINRNLFASFEKIISYTYRADDASDIERKLTAVLAPSSIHIGHLYRVSAINGASILPPLEIVLRYLQNEDIRPDAYGSRAMEECLMSSLSLCSSLVRLGNTPGNESSLEKQLLNLTPAFVRLLSSQTAVGIKSLSLMAGLLEACGNSQPASLLGHLGSVSAKSFIELLRSFAVLGPHPEIKVSAWKLAKQLVRKNQQWFAIMLLTGSPPQKLRCVSESTDKNSENILQGTPLFVTGMDAMSDVENLEDLEAIAILEFTAKAQENWIWAQNSLQSNPEYFSRLTTHVCELSFQGDSLRQCYQTQIASLVTQICTLHLYQVRYVRDGSMSKIFLPFLSWLSRNAVEVDAYNASLHANLRKNFAARYTPCTLNNFKRSPFSDAVFGRQYFYDIDLATKMLFPGLESSGSSASVGKSFSDELCRANLNLSLVQSQVALLQSFKAICVEHVTSFVHDRELQKVMCHVVQRCIQANTRDCPPEKLFDNLFLMRSDLALAIIQQLVQIKAKGSDLIALLGSCWECLRYGNTTLETAILSNSLPYYRTNLSTLLLAMQFHIQKGQRASSAISDSKTLAPVHSYDSIIMEIASTCLVEGLQTAVRALNDQHQSSALSSVPSEDGIIGVKDVQLLLNVLQSLLRLPALPHLISQLSQFLSTSSISQSCLRLYSWSHVLTSPELGNVPVYAELSLQFLTSLSSLPPIAEELAVEGVLTIVSTSRITQSLRNKTGGVTQFDKQPEFQTLYFAWVSGMLPLCLNLLHSVGRAMAGEVAAFLNQFPQQLRRACNAFAMPTGGRFSSFGPISLEMAQEATTLALISHVLLAYRTAGASAGVDSWEVPALSEYDDNKKDLVEDMEDLLANQRKHLKARVVAVTDMERGWQASKDTSELERRIAAELETALVCLKADVEMEKM